MPLIALGIAGAIAGGIGSAVAGGEQASAAESAQQLQAQEAQNALDFQKQEWETQQKNEAPFLKAGQGAITTLHDLLKTIGEGLLAPWTGTFKAPTAEEARATPGYEFTREQGLEALQNSAAASGGLTTTGTAKGIESYATGLADTTYGQTYQRALDAYQLAYNTFQQNQTNTFNRLAAVSGEGQTTASTLGSEGAAAASNVGNIFLTAGQQQGQALYNAGAATASGYAGVGNAVSGGITGITGLLELQQILKQQQAQAAGAGSEV